MLELLSDAVFSFLPFLGAASSFMSPSGQGASSSLDLSAASESGDITSGPVNFGVVTLGGIRQGASLPELPSSPVALVVVAAFALGAIFLFRR